MQSSRIASALADSRLRFGTINGPPTFFQNGGGRHGSRLSRWDEIIVTHVLWFAVGEKFLLAMSVDVNALEETRVHLPHPRIPILIEKPVFYLQKKL